ncbi:hypothetical protein [Parasphingorhabdus sp. NYA22]
MQILSAHSGADVHVHGLLEDQRKFEDQYLGAAAGSEKRTYQAQGNLGAAIANITRSVRLFRRNRKSKPVSTGATILRPCDQMQ